MEAEQALGRLKAHPHASPYNLAGVHAALGNREPATRSEISFDSFPEDTEARQDRLKLAGPTTRIEP